MTASLPLFFLDYQIDVDSFQGHYIFLPRHKAFNWLVGCERVYSEVTADT